MALSKTWTLTKLQSFLRVLVNEIAPDKVQDLSLVDFLNLATQDVAEMLAAASLPEYGTTATVTESAGVIDVSNLVIDKVIKIVDGTNGLASPKPDFAYENLSNIDQYKDSLFYNWFGDKIYLFIGSNLTKGTLTLYYYRQPTLLSSGSDYIDISDKYVSLVIAKAKTMIYEQLNRMAPEALTSLIESKTAEIRRLNREETADVNKRQAK